MKKKILLIIIFILVLCGCNKKTYNHTITYNQKSSYYIIKVNNNSINVEKKINVQCIKAPCNPITSDKYTIKNNTEYKKFVDELFKDTNDNKITISNTDLNDNQREILSKIIKTDIKEDITYEIGQIDYYNNKYKIKGYYVEEKDNNVLVTIAMGEHSSGGYSIKIDNVVINNEDVIIYVSEERPNIGQIVTEALTQPTVPITFNRMPKSIKIINIYTNEEYKRIEN